MISTERKRGRGRGKAMKDTIFYVGGSKGGVGKSIVALTLVQFLIDRYGDVMTDF